MRVLKAKRKLLKWERYDAKCRKLVNEGIFAKYYYGHRMAHCNYLLAKRTLATGLRIPYLPSWNRL